MKKIRESIKPGKFPEVVSEWKPDTLDAELDNLGAAIDNLIACSEALYVKVCDTVQASAEDQPKDERKAWMVMEDGSQGIQDSAERILRYFKRMSGGIRVTCYASEVTQ